ncbi:MAG: ComEC/Rec2 family competence protein [Desulfobacterales bacterium]|jgi:competence protein ComEC|nr:ComEC/Rec2 family competence protein [Desulfobacterales bacterium]
MIHALFPAACYARPVIPLTIAFMAGIVLGSRGTCGWWSAASLAVCLAAGAMVLLRLTRGRPARFSPLVLLAALGALSMQPWSCPRLPDHHVGRFVDTGPWEITGTVDARPLEFESRTRFALRAEHLGDGGKPQAASGLLRVTLIGPSPALEQGDRIVFKSRIRPIRNFNNPGGFDYRRTMGHQGVWAAAVAEAADVLVLDRTANGGLLGVVDRVRGRIARQIDDAGLGSEAAVLKALVLGERAGVPPEVRAAFTRSGVSHVLAISGLHIGIVASAAFLLFRRLLGFSTRLLMTGWARKGAALLTLAPVCLYALLAGMSPSTQRALVMAVVFLLAFLFEREHELMNTLALAALVILSVHPPALFSISFQLSFAAVAVIVAGMPEARRTESGALRPIAPSMAGRTRRAAALFVWVSVLATVGTLPLVLHYFNTVSFISVPANILAVPVIGYAVVLLGLTGALAGLVWPAAAEVLFSIGGRILANAMSAIQWLAELPFAAVQTVTPSWVEIALFYAALGCVLYMVKCRRLPRAAAPAGGRAAAGGATAAAGKRLSLPDCLLRLHPAGALLAVCLFAGAADAGYWFYHRYWHRDLRMTLIDVGQGSAALLELPGGRTVLVDGGGFSENSEFDVGAAVVAPFLWRHKIATVDRLILTHPNSDHLNGLVFIANHFNVGSLWTNGEAWGSSAFRELMRAVAERGIEMPRFEELPHDSLLNGVRLEVFYPPPDYHARKETDRWRRDPNNNSLVTRFSFGEVSVLLPGDIMRPAEKELAHLAGGRLRSTILVAPHHGSRSSSSEELLGAVQPRAVFIPCAGRPGLPHPQVLERYEGMGAKVFRTDKNGAIRFVTDGRLLAIEPFIAQ